MREKSLDEFESIFEQASIPVLDIRELPLPRIAAVLKGDPLDESMLKLAAHLKARFQAEVRVHWGAKLRDAEILRRAAEQELPPADRPFASTEELVGQVRIGRCSLLLVPSPQMKEARLVDREALVTGADAPVLFVPRPIDDPATLFKRILHSLPGNFRQTRNFAFSFTLVDDHGEILLLHTIDEDELEDVRQALRVSPDIESQDRQELLETLARHAERYLKGVVAASRKMPYEVRYRLTVGQAVAAVEEELARGGFGLLVVGAHQEGYSEVDAEVYQLMHTVEEVPVLAL